MSENRNEKQGGERDCSGSFWKNGGAQGIQFVIAILLARLLTPAEYGVVGDHHDFYHHWQMYLSRAAFPRPLVQKKAG